MPFNFTQPLATARIDFGAVCHKYLENDENNYGYLDIHIITSAGDLLIFHMQGNEGEQSYNYTQSQTPGALEEQWRGYTDITNIVKGQTSFSMEIIATTGWAYYSWGGQFCPTLWTTTNPDGSTNYANSNFYLSGTTNPINPANSEAFIPYYPSDANGSSQANYTAGSNFTNWAVNRGAIATNFSTFQNTSGATVSGVTNSSGTGTILVPIDYTYPINTTVLNYSASCSTTGSDDVTVTLIPRGGTATKLFEMNSGGSNNFNFTTGQKPTTSGSWSGYTDITRL